MQFIPQADLRVNYSTTNYKQTREEKGHETAKHFQHSQSSKITKSEDVNKESLIASSYNFTFNHTSQALHRDGILWQNLSRTPSKVHDMTAWLWQLLCPRQYAIMYTVISKMLKTKKLNPSPDLPHTQLSQFSQVSVRNHHYAFTLTHYLSPISPNTKVKKSRTVNSLHSGRYHKDINHKTSSVKNTQTMNHLGNLIFVCTTHIFLS